MFSSKRPLKQPPKGGASSSKSHPQGGFTSVNDVFSGKARAGGSASRPSAKAQSDLPLRNANWGSSSNTKQQSAAKRPPEKKKQGLWDKFLDVAVDAYGEYREIRYESARREAERRKQQPHYPQPKPVQQPQPTKSTPKKTPKIKGPLSENKHLISYPKVQQAPVADTHHSFAHPRAAPAPPGPAAHPARRPVDREHMTQMIGRSFGGPESTHGGMPSRQDTQVQKPKNAAKRPAVRQAPAASVRSQHGTIKHVDDPESRPVTAFPGAGNVAPRAGPSGSSRGQPPSRPARPNQPSHPPILATPMNRTCTLCHRNPVLQPADQHKLCETCTKLGFKPSHATPPQPGPPLQAYFPPSAAQQRAVKSKNAGAYTIKPGYGASPRPLSPLVSNKSSSSSSKQPPTRSAAPLGAPTLSRALNNPGDIHPALRGSYMNKLGGSGGGNSGRESADVAPPRRLQEATAHVYTGPHSGTPREIDKVRMLNSPEALHAASSSKSGTVAQGARLSRVWTPDGPDVDAVVMGKEGRLAPSPSRVEALRKETSGKGKGKGKVLPAASSAPSTPRDTGTASSKSPSTAAKSTPPTPSVATGKGGMSGRIKSVWEDDWPSPAPSRVCSPPPPAHVQSRKGKVSRSAPGSPSSVYSCSTAYAVQEMAGMPGSYAAWESGQGYDATMGSSIGNSPAPSIRGPLKEKLPPVPGVPSEYASCVAGQGRFTPAPSSTSGSSRDRKGKGKQAPVRKDSRKTAKSKAPAPKGLGIEIPGGKWFRGL